MCTPCEEYGCDYETIASWPSGPDETTLLRRCKDCGQQYEDEIENK